MRQICDRFWLFTIAALSLAAIGAVLISVAIAGKMPDDAGELYAAAVTGLLLVVQKVIEAQQQRRTTDLDASRQELMTRELARSAPTPEPIDETTVKGSNK